MAKSFQVSLAPQQLWQAINPWTFNSQGAQFGLINIDLGQTPHPEVEQEVLDQVGSYGRQLGRMGDALAVLIDLTEKQGLTLTAEQSSILKAASVQIDQVGRIKKRAGL